MSSGFCGGAEVVRQAAPPAERFGGCEEPSLKLAVGKDNRYGEPIGCRSGVESFGPRMAGQSSSLSRNTKTPPFGRTFRAANPTAPIRLALLNCPLADGLVAGSPGLISRRCRWQFCGTNLERPSLHRALQLPIRALSASQACPIEKRQLRSTVTEELGIRPQLIEPQQLAGSVQGIMNGFKARLVDGATWVAPFSAYTANRRSLSISAKSSKSGLCVVRITCLDWLASRSASSSAPTAAGWRATSGSSIPTSATPGTSGPLDWEAEL